MPVTEQSLVARPQEITNPMVDAGPILSYRDYTRSLRYMALLLLAIGLIVRVERYALRFPIWGDEAFVTVNFLERDYLALTKQLECGQVIPVLFLWTELAIKRLLGTSEWSMRLMPFLFGCGSLWLMWFLARQTVSRLAAMLSVGILAVASWPIAMSCFVKPYSADLFLRWLWRRSRSVGSGIQVTQAGSRCWHSSFHSQWQVPTRSYLWAERLVWHCSRPCGDSRAGGQNSGLRFTIF